MVRSLLSGPLVSIAPVYIPFRLFDVTIDNGGNCQRLIAALDAVTGALDLYRFDSIPTDFVEVETRNRPHPRLNNAEPAQLVKDKVRRMIFTQGFFRVRQLSIRVEHVPGDIYIPYWVGIRKNGGRPRLSVMDAVRRRMEGAKVRNLLESWLMNDSVQPRCMS